MEWGPRWDVMGMVVVVVVVVVGMFLYDGGLSGLFPFVEKCLALASSGGSLSGLA